MQAEPEDSSDTASFTSGENDIFAIKESLIPLQQQKVAGITEVDFNALLDPPLQLKEDLKEGCGGQLWPAGMVLGRYMLRYHREDLVGKTILELGAGGGLVGLAVAIGCDIGPSKLYITDQIPMFQLMKDNIALNKLEDKVSAVVYDWGEPMPSDIVFDTSKTATTTTTTTEEKSTSLPSKPDIILAADCVYFEPAFPLLKDTLVELLDSPTSPPDAVCYFCFKKRRKADWRFMKMIGKVLDVKEFTDAEDVGREIEMYPRDGIYLYRITRKKKNSSGESSTI